MANNDFTQDELKNEEWRDVVGYEGWYQVSNLGRVKRTMLSSGTRGGVILRRQPQVNKYYAVDLFRNAERARRLVHSIVAEAFIGKRPKGHQVNHKNGKGTDNRVNNLEYVTPKENTRHAIDALGVRFGSSVCGEQVGTSKLTQKQVLLMRDLYETGNYTQAELADKFNVRQAHVSRIILRQAWKHI